MCSSLTQANYSRTAFLEKENLLGYFAVGLMLMISATLCRDGDGGGVAKVVRYSGMESARRQSVLFKSKPVPGNEGMA